MAGEVYSRWSTSSAIEANPAGQRGKRSDGTEWQRGRGGRREEEEEMRKNTLHITNWAGGEAAAGGGAAARCKTRGCATTRSSGRRRVSERILPELAADWEGRRPKIEAVQQMGSWARVLHEEQEVEQEDVEQHDGAGHPLPVL
ncbi:unnamed protein product [Calypogeia fissa]